METEKEEKSLVLISKDDINFLTNLFYTLIGIAASLIMFFVFYWSLRLDSSITTFINVTKNEPVYFWLYIFFTFGAIILFGMNAAILTYRWRKFGFPSWKKQAGTGLGSLVGVFASACPSCGALLLSTIGVTAGLAAFPFQGLELKALSFALVAIPLWLTRNELTHFECNKGTCPPMRDHSFKEHERPWLLILTAIIAAFGIFSWNLLKSDPAVADLLQAKVPETENINESSGQYVLFQEAEKKVLPAEGFQSKIILSDSVVKLVEKEVINKDKFTALYDERGGLPNELKNVLNESSSQPILLTQKNANNYLNLLWPLGLANYMKSNNNSPINDDSLFNFASTGGWTLGKEENGGVYFNKFKIVELTPEQENLVVKIAENTYRPCCNNSTFFQDCNHGSALLGLLQLGASQGLGEEELYKEALAFNSFWFPGNYVEIALYFKAVKNIDWENIDPKFVMNKDFSSASGWRKNIHKEVSKLNLMPEIEGGGGCGV